jgi:hypothetical protein
MTKVIRVLAMNQSQPQLQTVKMNALDAGAVLVRLSVGFIFSKYEQMKYEGWRKKSFL